MTRKFQNPQNGYVEEVGTASLALTSVFGPIYLLYRGAWFAALVHLLVAPITFGAALLISGGAPAIVLPIFFAGLFWIAFFTQPLVCIAYLRRGWHEIR